MNNAYLTFLITKKYLRLNKLRKKLNKKYEHTINNKEKKQLIKHYESLKKITNKLLKYLETIKITNKEKKSIIKRIFKKNNKQRIINLMKKKLQKQEKEIEMIIRTLKQQT